MARVTYRRRTAYNTPSNKTRIVKTPGGRFVVQHIEKKASPKVCGHCNRNLSGISRARPVAMQRIKRSKRTVTRAYGGNLCHACVRERVLRAFIAGELKAAQKTSH
eukprot:TRINITY_DN3125_c0_g1_i6.p2 TRINITY_DN3125_c0_g1~~TRINITY_DN3125_c0_g1_i6.p2  ORF type:complete len:106 (-),score=10.03 TRINITY_DN3125_c0_g1_i6:42-359(-)